MGNDERLEIIKNDSEPGTQRWFWHWKTANNEIVATSGEPFDNKTNAYDAAERVVEKLKHPLPIRFIEEK